LVFGGTTSVNYATSINASPVAASGPYTVNAPNLTVNTAYTFTVKALYANPVTNDFTQSTPSAPGSATVVLTTPISIAPNPPLGFLPVSMNLPDWMSAVEPVDSPESGDGPSSAISVNLAFGVARFDSGADLIIANPNGPDITFQRIYRTAMAAGNLSSKGLTPGWTHNWDLWLVPTQSNAWGPVQLVYPSGASEPLTPILSNGQPTGVLVGPPGCPYTAVGVPSSVVGTWNSITLTQNGHDQEVFTIPSGSAVFRIQKKFFSNNSVLLFSWTANQLTAIASAPPRNRYPNQPSLVNPYRRLYLEGNRCHLR
jgi:hypothetical protein